MCKLHSIRNIKGFSFFFLKLNQIYFSSLRVRLMHILHSPSYKKLLNKYKMKGFCVKNYSNDLRLHGVLITTLSVLKGTFHVDLRGNDGVTVWSFTLMEGAWFSSTFGFKLKKSLFFCTMSMSALPHMANPAAVGLGRERPISGSDFFQSWPKWKHLVLIRDSGCDSCSGSCEDLAVSCNADCGTRTKYTNISTVIMCQVKQAIEGSGCLC